MTNEYQFQNAGRPRPLMKAMLILIILLMTMWWVIIARVVEGHIDKSRRMSRQTKPEQTGTMQTLEYSVEAEFYRA